MLHELLSIFRSDKPLASMGRNFAQMLRLTYEMTVEAGDIYFGETASPDERTQIYKRDVQVNKLERTIRKQVIAHLSLAGSSASLPYCLLLMSLVKDVERLGDYAKNLSEVREYHPD
ncbi:MAG: PhoU domain-containing protein, partial [Gemmatimonadota bacterium]